MLPYDILTPYALARAVTCACTMPCPTQWQLKICGKRKPRPQSRMRRSTRCVFWVFFWLVGSVVFGVCYRRKVYFRFGVCLRCLWGVLSPKTSVVFGVCYISKVSLREVSVCNIRVCDISKVSSCERCLWGLSHKGLSHKQGFLM